MGTWGTGPFDNDEASDWVYDLEAGGLEVLRDGLTLTVGREYVEAPDATIVIAAAEVVACMAGHPPEGELPDEVAAFLREAGTPDPKLLDAAREGLERVMGESSELRELWAESDSFGEWQSLMLDLKRRLAK